MKTAVPTATCKRCGKVFIPRPLPTLAALASCCGGCQLRNLLDGLGLPTPPAMLDRWTKRPCLTEEEYLRKTVEGLLENRGENL